MEFGDANAYHNLAVCYAQGVHGMPQDSGKALELYEMGRGTWPHYII